MRLKQKQFKASFYRSVMCHPTLLVASDTKIICFHNCGLLWIAAEFDCHQAALDSCRV